jgi:LMBR1-like membrane protein
MDAAAAAFELRSRNFVAGGSLAAMAVCGGFWVSLVSVRRSLGAHRKAKGRRRKTRRVRVATGSSGGGSASRSDAVRLRAIVWSAPFWLCAVALGVALLTLVLMPVAVVSGHALACSEAHRAPQSEQPGINLLAEPFREAMSRPRESSSVPEDPREREFLHGVLHWLNAELVHGMGTLVFWGSLVALFVLIPFAYFFDEAVGVFWFDRGRGLSRFVETVIELTLILSMCVAALFMLHSIFSLRGSDYEAPGLANFMRFTYLTLSGAGAVYALFGVQFGFSLIFRETLAMLPEKLLISPSEKLERLEKLALKEQVCEQLINRLELAPTDASRLGIFDIRLPIQHHTLQLQVEDELDQAWKTLARIEDHRRALSQYTRRGALRRVVLFSVASAVNLFIPAYIGLHIFASQLSAVHAYLLRWIDHHEDSSGLHQCDALGHLSLVLDVASLMYVAAAALCGVLLTDRTRDSSGEGEPPRTVLRELVVGTASFVAVASSAPLVGRMLDLSRFDLAGSYGFSGNFVTQNHGWMVVLFNWAFLGALLRNYFSFFPIKAVVEKVVRRHPKLANLFRRPGIVFFRGVLGAVAGFVARVLFFCGSGIAHVFESMYQYGQRSGQSATASVSAPSQNSAQTASPSVPGVPAAGGVVPASGAGAASVAGGGSGDPASGIRPPVFDEAPSVASPGNPGLPRG